MEEYKFVLIKIREGTTIHVKAKEKLYDGSFKYFGLKGSDYDDINRSLILYCDDKDINELHWCKCDCCSDSKGKYLKCKSLYSSSSPVVIMNACDSIFLDINVDFEEKYR